jgi:transcriptional regulator with XRE-family HTH domain
MRSTRLAVGRSQDVIAHAAGMSPAQYGRLERGEIRHPTIDQLCRACAALGLDLVVRSFPAGDPVRDAAHLRLLGLLRAELHPSLAWRTEVPLPLAGDPRAWDACISGEAESAAVEAETRLGDIQDLDRRVALKQRDGGMERVILLVAATPRNRETLLATREALRPRFPLDSRAVLAALRSGRLPPAGGIVLLRSREPTARRASERMPDGARASPQARS